MTSKKTCYLLTAEGTFFRREGEMCWRNSNSRDVDTDDGIVSPIKQEMLDRKFKELRE